MKNLLIGEGMLSISRLVEPEPTPAAPESKSRMASSETGSDTDGAIAQLGERLHGMQEVSGSIPLSSTNFLQSVVAKNHFSAVATVTVIFLVPLGHGDAIGNAERPLLATVIGGLAALLVSASLPHRRPDATEPDRLGQLRKA